MRKVLRFLKMAIAPVVICLALLAVIVAPVAAQGLIVPGQVPAPAADPLAIVLNLALAFGGLVGVSALVTVIVNVGKWVGIVQDGTAGAWSAGLNLAAFGILIGLSLFNPSVTLTFMDEKFGQLAQIGVIVLGYLTQVVGSGRIYAWLKGLKIPILSKSFSG